MANLSNINGKFVVEQTTGYVGVGTTDPEYLLHVNSSDIPNGTRLTIENTNGSGKKYGLISDNTGVFTVRDLTASSDRFAISNLGNANFTGKLGVGLAPVEQLTVSGAIMSTGGITGHGANRTTISQEGANGAFWQSYGANSSTYGTFVLRQASSDFSLTRTPLSIDSSGNSTFAESVVIGTSINTGIPLVVQETTADGFAIGFMRNTNSTNGNGLVVDVNSTGGVYIQDWRQAGSVKMRLKQNGNLGIGTDDPVKTLDVRGSLAISNSTASYWYMDRNDATGDFDLNENTNGTLFSVSTNGLGSFVNTSIGDKLLLAGDNAASARGLMFNCSTTTNQGDTWDIDAQSSTGIIKFSTGSTPKMTIDSSGNVGVGSGTPLYLLGDQDIGQIAVNRVPSTGVITDTSRSAAYINLNASNGGSSLTFHTANANNTAPTERMRITEAGGISFGSTGTAYGTSGQVLTSNGNAAPTWQAAGGGTVTWPNVGAGIRTDYILGFKPPGSGYAGFYFQTAAGGHAGYLLIRGTSNAGQIYKAEGITLVSDSSWVTIASRTTTNAGVRLMSGATSAERLVIQDNGHSYFQGNLGIGTSSTSFSSDYDNLIVGSGSGNNGIGIYSSSTGNSTLAFLPTTGSQSDFEIRVEHDYPFGNMEVYFQHSSDYYLRMFERNNGQDPIIKVGHNNIPVGINSGDDATMQFRPDSNNWYPAIAINAEDSQGNSRGFIEMKSNRSNTFQADYFLKFFNYNGNEIGSIRVNNNNNNVAYNTSSDYRLKEDLKEFKALDTISKIKVYNYKWKNDSSGFRDQGILAHELDELIPQAVSGEKDATDEDNNILPQSVDYSKIVPHLVQSIQELKAEIEILKNK